MDQKPKHLLNRATFGISPEALNPEKINVENLLATACEQKFLNLVTLPEKRDYDKGNPEERKEFRQKLREQQIRLNTTWINQMKDPSVVLREKMTFFWHDHFACHLKNPFAAQQQNNTLRQHALGKFSDLLMAISKDPAMLQFLNNQQNRKDSPNENFAREVMELFTLGRGNYTEQDIKNAARAFTGWGFNQQTGSFVFRAKAHDYGSKTFRGKTGDFTGEDIIAMILEDKNTASFITQKLWKFFVNDEKVDNGIIDELSKDFYRSGYDISKLLSNMLASDWFFDSQYSANRIKSPVEFIVGLQVQTNGKFNTPENLVFLQKALGQVLFQPPNVGGWPTGKAWIDSSSLALRMSLPAQILRNSQAEFEAKDDGDVNNVTNDYKKAREISFSTDWEKLSNVFTRTSATETVDNIEHHLLAKPTSAANRKMIQTFVGQKTSDADFIKKIFIGFMSLPEYQLS